MPLFHRHQDADGVNPLYDASLRGDTDMVRQLLDSGALPDTEGGRHHTALNASLVNNHYDTAVLLIERGADVNHRHGVSDTTPLGHVLFHGHLVHNDNAPQKDMITLLLEHGADANKSVGAKMSPLTAVKTKLCRHTKPHAGCVKCMNRNEWLEIIDLLKAYGGHDSYSDAGEKVWGVLADDTGDSDPEVAHAARKLKDAKAAKKARDDARILANRAEFGQDHVKMLELAPKHSNYGDGDVGRGANTDKYDSDPEVAMSQRELERAKVSRESKKKLLKEVKKASRPGWSSGGLGTNVRGPNWSFIDAQDRQLGRK